MLNVKKIYICNIFNKLQKKQVLIPAYYTTLFTYNTYPNFDKQYLIDKYTKYYESQKKIRNKILQPIDNEYNNYYKPIHFHLYGSWDILTTSFIDNSQLITKSIQTGFFDESPSSFMNAKINTGLMFENAGLGLNDFNTINAFKLCGNINLTISKKWLLPNGYKLIDFIIQKILKISKNVIILNSFSSYELSVLILGNKLSKIGEIAQNIRELKFTEDDKKYNFIPLNPETQLVDSNLFSDSNTLFGVRYDNNGKIIQDADIDVKMLIELEVRPSKNLEIINLLNRCGLIVNTKPGKFDVIAFKTNYEFSNEIIAKIKDSKLTDHIRNFKTILLFEEIKINELRIQNDQIYIANNKRKTICSELWSKVKTHLIHVREKYTESIREEEIRGGNQAKETKKFLNFIDCRYDYKKINENLKILKVSKALRYQTVKMFFTYQNALADPISYSYFLDLIYYVKNIEKYIEKEATKVVSAISLPMVNSEIPSKILRIESEIKEFLEIFEEAYIIRYVNDHSLDEVVPDFMIRQAGGQLQAICSTYDNVAKFMISALMGKEYNKIITSFDDTVIELKNLHLKLSPSQLFEPATLLFVLLKEALNLIVDQEFHNLKDKAKKTNKDDVFKDFNIQIRKFLKENIEHRIYKFKSVLESKESEHYLFNDYLRLTIFFKHDFKLFYYHHMASLLMTPSLYYTSGALRRGSLSKELYRLFLLALIYKNKTGSDDFLNLIRDNPPNIESKIDWMAGYDDLKVSLDTQQFKEVLNSLDIYLFPFEKTLTKRLESAIECKEIIEADEIPIFNCFWEGCLGFMNIVKPQNAVVPSFLARNWLSGDAQLHEDRRANKICNDNPDSYFLIDPQGGIYFHNYEKMKEYTIIRNKFLMGLMHMSSIYKTQLYRSYQNKYNG